MPYLKLFWFVGFLFVSQFCFADLDYRLNCFNVIAKAVDQHAMNDAIKISTEKPVIDVSKLDPIRASFLTPYSKVYSIELRSGTVSIFRGKSHYGEHFEEMSSWEVLGEYFPYGIANENTMYIYRAKVLTRYTNCEIYNFQFERLIAPQKFIDIKTVREYFERASKL